MIEEFFTPISKDLLSSSILNEGVFENSVLKYVEGEEFPDLKGVNLVLFDVKESRGAVNNEGAAIGADTVRKELYKLYTGNWNVSIADLGSVRAGNMIKDTYFAVKEIIFWLLKNNTLPILIGGSQDLIYANYKSYDKFDQTVNLAVASPKFNFGNVEDELSSMSFLSKIILEEPCNLFNYANLGYQTFYNSSEEITLIDKLSFEAHRVGILKDITIAEPVMRDADIVAIDIGVVRASEAPGNQNSNPNGLYGDDICALSRYAGISDKVTSFGIYEFNPIFDNNNQTSKLISQMIWYFIEGFSLRANDYPYGSKDSYLKYLVPFEDNVICFYQSDKSLRWWMQVEVDSQSKYKRHVLIPCSEDDYLNAIEGTIPDRWINVYKKIF